MSGQCEFERVEKLRIQAAGLPDSPGVYRFHGDVAQALIYIGKSINLRKRVLSHFSAASSDSRERKLVSMSQTISFTVTPGELSALLLESEEVKEKQPLLNRRLRRQRNLVTFELAAHENFARGTTTLLQPKLVAASWPPSDEQHQYFGLFTSKHHAQRQLRDLATAHELCLVALGLENSRRACFGYQLRRCRGVCAGSESPQSHNRRLLAAVADDAVKVWPFSGPVAIQELPRAESVSVINQWYYLGSCASIAEARALVGSGAGKRTLLDRDAYRIVSRWLLSPPDTTKIISL